MTVQINIFKPTLKFSQKMSVSNINVSNDTALIIVRSQKTKTKLLANSITINDIHVKMYSENPYKVDLECDTERIVFKDLPLWEPNSLISEFIKNQPQLI